MAESYAEADLRQDTTVGMLKLIEVANRDGRAQGPHARVSLRQMILANAVWALSRSFFIFIF